jgi:hypothetical protein
MILKIKAEQHTLLVLAFFVVFGIIAFFSSFQTATANEINPEENIDEVIFPSLYNTGLGGVIYADVNADSTYNPNDGDYPLADETVILSGKAMPQYVATSNRDGVYMFSYYEPGEYIITSESPVGWVRTTQDFGFVNLPEDNFFIGFDFGHYKMHTVSGHVYHRESGRTALSGQTVFADVNNNGLLNAGEASTKTNKRGEYTLFIGPGNSLVTICEVLNGRMQAFPTQGTSCGTNGYGHSVDVMFGGVTANTDFINLPQKQKPAKNPHILRGR